MGGERVFDGSVHLEGHAQTEAVVYDACNERAIGVCLCLALDQRSDRHRLRHGNAEPLRARCGVTRKLRKELAGKLSRDLLRSRAERNEVGARKQKAFQTLRPYAVDGDRIASERTRERLRVADSALLQ